MTNGQQVPVQPVVIGPAETLSVDQHCNMLTEHIRDRNSGIMEGFKLYIQMFSTIVGGSVVLRLQYGATVSSKFALLAEILVGLVFIMATVIILENLRSWYEYRKVLSVVAGIYPSGQRIIPMPQAWHAAKIEILMLAVMAVAAVLFHFSNPLNA